MPSCTGIETWVQPYSTATPIVEECKRPWGYRFSDEMTAVTYLWPGKDKDNRVFMAVFQSQTCTPQAQKEETSQVRD